MDKNIRLKLWTFIEEFRRVTGNELFFFDLIEKPTGLDKYLDVASNQDDLILNNIAAELSELRTQDNVCLVYGDNSKNYRHLLASKLTKGPLSFLDREELDNIASVGSLAIDEKNSIEKDLYLSQGKAGYIDWDGELRRCFRKLLDTSGNIKENEKLRLIDVYVKEGRIPLIAFENIFLEEKDKKILFESTNTKRSKWPITIAGAFFIAALSIGFYFNVDKNNTNVNKNAIVAPLRPAEIVVSGAITFDTTWHAETTYILSGPVFVEGDAVLTIEPGTRIRGGFASGLIVTKNAKINARGSKHAPIVFTSAKKVGERRRGDWGGLVLLGNARINQGINSIEGITKSDIRGQFGGNDDNDSCGVLEYVRIEFAGLEVFKDNELNGLTMGGCGRQTVVNHIQVHRAFDDGIEMFGGTADLKNIVITGARDDSLDWDMGWRGRVQFMVIQQYNDAGDNGFEADNWDDNHQALPRSNPTMYNVTMLGASAPQKVQRAMNLRRGTAGSFHNFIVTGHTNEFLDIRDEATVDLANSGDIRFSNSFIFNIGLDGKSPFSDEKDDDGGFSERDFMRAQKAVSLDVNPLLVSTQNQLSFNIIPRDNSPANGLLTSFPRDNFWDVTANYAGAVKPSARNENWLSGWTQYPEN